MTRRTLSRLLAACFTIAASAACVSPSDVNKEMLPHLEARDHDAALTVLEGAEDDFGEKNRVLYHLERGMLQHYRGEFAESNASFEIAKREAELHYTKSVSAEAGTFLANDNTRPYYGENFERALIHVFSAINYEALGQTDEALVEIRQLNFFLRQLVVDGEQDNSYRDDAFGHYLAGIFFERDGDPDEAWIAYKKALHAYTSHEELYGTAPPEGLVRSEAGLAMLLDSPPRDVPVALQQGRIFGQQLFAEEEAPGGEVLVLHYNGRAPFKIDTFVDVAVVDGWPLVYKIDVDGEDKEKIARAGQIATSVLASDVVRVAFPSYRAVPRRIARLEVAAEGAPRSISAERMVDIGAIAEQDLADRIHRVRAKAIARAVVKYVLSEIAEQAIREAGGEYGGLAGALFSVGSAVARTASEVADKRAWFTVPDEIWLARLALTEGEHELRLVFRDGRGGVVREELRPVRVEAGGLHFVIVRTVE